jgi:hypothetical protein
VEVVYYLATISLVKVGGLPIRCIFLNASGTLPFVRTIQRLDTLQTYTIGKWMICKTRGGGGGDDDDNNNNNNNNNSPLLGMRQMHMREIL